MTRVLVTGASTPLGAALITRLLQDSRVTKVLAVGHHISSPVAARDARVHYERLDLSKARAIRTLIFGPARELEITTVVDLALHRNADASGKELHALNVESTRQILQLSERHPTIRRFVLRSHAEAYDIRNDLPALLSEEHPLNLSPENPQWLRDRIEADLTVCAHMGMSPVSIAVLRCAECLAAGVGSQFYDLLASSFRLVPLGFDPMMNVLSLPDLVEALTLATFSDKQGVFNIPGADTLPLSEIFRKWGKSTIAIPSPLLKPAYAMQGFLRHGEFHYRSNRRRFHFGGVLDGRRAEEQLGYRPRTHLAWE